jgi:hypothetical protein
MSVYRRVPGNHEEPYSVTLLGRNPRLLDSRINEQYDSMSVIYSEGTRFESDKRSRTAISLGQRSVDSKSALEV